MHTNICIADDHPLFGRAIEEVLSTNIATAKVSRLSEVTGLQQTIGNGHAVDLLLLDLHMPGSVGFSTLSWVLGQSPRLPIIMISANTHPETVRRALDHGAAGFLSKSAEETTIVNTVRQVLEGVRGLTPGLSVASKGESLGGLDAAEAIASMTAQQFRVASMLVEGQLNKQIAYELNVKEATIKAHMTEIFRKLGVQSRTQAVLVLSKLLPETDQDYDSPVG